MVELTEQVQSQTFTMPWLFPLPEPHASKGGGRGLNIAWTVLQSDWQYEAEQQKLCQTTEHQSVLAFVRENAALKEACEANPKMLANYAPQLLIPEFSGEYGPAFDKLLAESEAETRRRPDPRNPYATCDKYLALRHPTFGSHTAREVADKWVNGLGGYQSAKVHNYSDYVFWLLAKDSNWMPAQVRETLITGMRDWAVWRMDLISSDNWDSKLTDALYRSRKTPMKWTRVLRGRLAECAERTVRKLGLVDDPMRIADAFITRNFVGGLDALVQRRNQQR